MLSPCLQSCSCCFQVDPGSCSYPHLAWDAWPFLFTRTWPRHSSPDPVGLHLCLCCGHSWLLAQLSMVGRITEPEFPTAPGNHKHNLPRPHSLPSSPRHTWLSCVCRAWLVGLGRCGHPSLTAMFVPLALKEVCGQVLSGISQQIPDASSLSPPESSNSALLEMAQLRHPPVM